MKSLDDINVIVEKMESKFELSHQATAKTISDFGYIISNTKDEVIELKTLLKDFILRTDKVIEIHENSIDELKKSDTEIRSAFKGGKWIAGIAVVIIIALGGSITTMWANAYYKDQTELRTMIKEHQDRETTVTNRLIEILSKKDTLNQSEINAVVNTYKK